MVIRMEKDNRDIENLRTWNKVASLYAEKMMNLPMYEESYKLFCELLNDPEARILDIGCGPGVISAYLHQQCPTYQLSGIDFSAEMISQAQSHLPQGHFQVMDCRQMNFEAASFDGVVSGFCIPYLDPIELENFFKDIAGMMREGGALYVSFVEGDAEASGYITGSTGDRTYFFHHDLNRINQLTESIGFKQIRTLKIEYLKANQEVQWHTVLILKKQTGGHYA